MAPAASALPPARLASTCFSAVIRLPAASLIKGYQPLMPPLPLTDADVDALVDYVKTL